MYKEKEITVLAIKELLAELQRNSFSDNDEGDYKQAVNRNKIHFWQTTLSKVETKD